VTELGAFEGWGTGVTISRSDKVSRSRAPSGTRQQPRLADVAEAANVSTATVSRVINSPDVVSDEVRERVQRAIQGLSWVPNASAIALATSRTRTVGAIMPTLDHQNFARIVETLQATLSASRYDLLISCTHYDRESATHQARTMVERGVEALVLVGADQPEGLFALMDRQKTPHVLLYVAPGSVPTRQIVGYDNYQAFSRITEYLVELGHRSLGLIAQSTVFNDRARARQQGVRDTLAEHGLAIRPRHFVEGNWKVEDGMKAFQAIMSTVDPPTAVVCGNDYLAIGCLLQARAMGLDVPRDVSVTGFDDVDMARLLDPGLTTMRVPDAEVGVMTGQYLVDVLEGRPGVLGTVPAPELIVRGSTAAPIPTKL
jgi:LacI family transcriptional regulator